MYRLLIIGGSDAGISAALRAREISSDAKITLVVADRFPNYSICGIPFYLSGEVGDWKDLAHRTAADIENQAIELLLEHRAEAVDVGRKEVSMINLSGETKRLPYDRLVIATGAVSIRPPIQDITLPGVFFLRWMRDAFDISRWLSDRCPKSALVVGGGYIGMEIADALTHRGIAVTVVEYTPNVLQTVDPDLGELVRAELAERGVAVVTGVGVKSISQEGERLRVTGRRDFEKTVDMIVVATGAAPETALAKSAGIATGIKGAISVDRKMATSAADVFAAGDCAETYHRLLGRNTYFPLGTTAHKQGRIAGENAVGGSREFSGTLGTQVVKIFGLVVARTGLREEEAKAAGFDPLSVDSDAWDHKAYYPGATRMKIRMTADRRTGRLLGAQIVGRHGAEVSKRVDVLATALFHEMKVENLVDLDLSYTPPLSSPWDPVQMCAQLWSQELRRSR
jgi:NADPH-dependent 2,4-dienoyl-CoA reductase/sulfur reductase-like enzyme